jgi:hypothetical protein
LAEHTQRPLNNNGAPEEENATEDQQKLVAHVIGLLRRVVAAFREDKES